MPESRLLSAFSIQPFLKVGRKLYRLSILCINCKPIVTHNLQKPNSFFQVFFNFYAAVLRKADRSSAYRKKPHGHSSFCTRAAVCLAKQTGYKLDDRAYGVEQGSVGAAEIRNGAQNAARNTQQTEDHIKGFHPFFSFPAANVHVAANELAKAN